LSDTEATKRIIIANPIKFEIRRIFVNLKSTSELYDEEKNNGFLPYREILMNRLQKLKLMENPWIG
jgi:hypothetical protein